MYENKKDFSNKYESKKDEDNIILLFSMVILDPQITASSWFGISHSIPSFWEEVPWSMKHLTCVKWAKCNGIGMKITLGVQNRKVIEKCVNLLHVENGW